MKVVSVPVTLRDRPDQEVGEIDDVGGDVAERARSGKLLFQAPDERELGSLIQSWR